MSATHDPKSIINVFEKKKIGSCDKYEPAFDSPALQRLNSYMKRCACAYTFAPPIKSQKKNYWHSLFSRYPRGIIIIINVHLLVC